MRKTQEGKLPREFKKKWLKALRGGRYKQGYYGLATAHGYCCLGVACRVAGYPKKSIAGGFIGDEYVKVPKALRGKAPKVEQLAHMNDIGVPFKEIADHIEKFF
jgi:hypothetical protein